MKGTLALAAVVPITGALLLAACSDIARRDVPLLGPMQINDPVVAAGQQLFMRNCNQCHPRGQEGVGIGLNDKPLPDFAIRIQVRNGFGAMPAFPEDQLSDEALESIIAYLDFLRKRGPFDNVL